MAAFSLTISEKPFEINGPFFSNYETRQILLDFGKVDQVLWEKLANGCAGKKGRLFN